MILSCSGLHPGSCCLKGWSHEVNVCLPEDLHFPMQTNKMNRQRLAKPGIIKAKSHIDSAHQAPPMSFMQVCRSSIVALIALRWQSILSAHSLPSKAMPLFSCMEPIKVQSPASTASLELDVLGWLIELIVY